MVPIERINLLERTIVRCEKVDSDTKVKTEKRSIISKSRLAELRTPGSIYIITCGLHGCPCNGKDEGCERGFFSLFIQAVYGIDFSIRMGIPYHVDFGNIMYRYSDNRMSDRNFWNYFFHQPTPELSKDSVSVLNKFIELYPLKIWDRNHFREIHARVIRHLSFTEDITLRLQERTHQFKNNNILGIHIRGTDHAEEIPPAKFDKYIKVISAHLPNYHKLFVATDDNNLKAKLERLYPDKIFFNEVERSNSGTAVHLNNALEDRIKLGLDVILDCFSLSACSKVILSPSNVSYAALLLNPELPYILIEHPLAKAKRLKTLLVYYMNKWGVRKW